MPGPGGVVTFDFAAWQARYPEFASVQEAAADLYFAEATLYVDNSPCSPICNLTTRAVILNMVTAQIAWLAGNNPGGNGTPTGLVGRISDAAEGSVSVRTEIPTMSANAAWFTQTPYGLAAWQAMAPYRTARYVPAPPMRGVPYGGYFG